MDCFSVYGTGLLHQRFREAQPFRGWEEATELMEIYDLKQEKGFPLRNEVNFMLKSLGKTQTAPRFESPFSYEKKKPWEKRGNGNALQAAKKKL